MGQIQPARASAEEEEEDATPVAMAQMNDQKIMAPAFDPDATLVRSAFVCNGSCQACLDRSFVCGDSSCTFFMRPFEETFQVEFTCLEPGGCGQTSPQPQLCECNGIPRKALVLAAPLIEESSKRQVYNATQLPALVKATDCGKHLAQAPRGTILPLAQRPGSDTQWANRHVDVTNIRFRAVPGGAVQADNYVIVAPKQVLSFSCHYTCAWQYSPNDYCPGCVIQWYLGIKPRPGDQATQINLIRVFGSGLRGRADDVEFTAPSLPGFYYLNAYISLDYHFVQGINFSNTPENSVAVIQVVYFDRWRPENHVYLGNSLEMRAIETLFLLGQHDVCGRTCLTGRFETCPCRIVGNPDLQSKIFSFLGPYRD